MVTDAYPLVLGKTRELYDPRNVPQGAGRLQS